MIFYLSLIFILTHLQNIYSMRLQQKKCSSKTKTKLSLEMLPVLKSWPKADLVKVFVMLFNFVQKNSPQQQQRCELLSKKKEVKGLCLFYSFWESKQIFMPQNFFTLFSHHHRVLKWIRFSRRKLSFCSVLQYFSVFFFVYFCNSISMMFLFGFGKSYAE